MAPPKAGTSDGPSASTPAAFDDEERLQQDRARYSKQFFEEQHADLPRGFAGSSWSPESEVEQSSTLQATRQEAYDRCAPDVVTLMRCIKEAGPSWSYSCGKEYATLQRCYMEAQGRGNWNIDDAVRVGKELVQVRVEKFQWWLNDTLAAYGFGGDSSSSNSSNSSPGSTPGEGSKQQQ